MPLHIPRPSRPPTIGISASPWYLRFHIFHQTLQIPAGGFCHFYSLCSRTRACHLPGSPADWTGVRRCKMVIFAPTVSGSLGNRIETCHQNGCVHNLQQPFTAFYSNLCTTTSWGNSLVRRIRFYVGRLWLWQSGQQLNSGANYLWIWELLWLVQSCFEWFGMSS